MQHTSQGSALHSMCSWPLYPLVLSVPHLRTYSFFISRMLLPSSILTLQFLCHLSLDLSCDAAPGAPAGAALPLT